MKSNFTSPWARHSEPLGFSTELLCLFIILAALIARPVAAATVLFDFEKQADLARMHDEGRDTLGVGKTLERVERFATSGKFALCFSTPQWKSGMPQWPAFECQPALTNWSGYDRLCFDVVNPSSQTQNLSLFVSDGRVPTRNGLSHQLKLPPFSYTPVSIPLDQLAEKKVNPAEIRVMHFFTTEPPAEMALHIDCIELLSKDEKRSPLPESFLRQFGALQQGQVENLRSALGDARGLALSWMAKTPTLKGWTSARFRELSTQLSALEHAVSSNGSMLPQVTQQLAMFGGEIDRVVSLIRFRSAFEGIKPGLRAGPAARSGMAVGTATSMEKVLPRGGTITGTVTNLLCLSLAHNEKESLQLLVAACEQNLRRVHVRIKDLRSTAGAVFSASNLQVSVVGYVKTTTTPPYGTSHIGWWPDPILEFQSAADIARGDVQAFWLRASAPRGQPAGNYVGKIEVLEDEKLAYALDFNVHVYSFAVPEASPLPLAITFSPEDSPQPGTAKEQAAWRGQPDYPVNAWRFQRQRWADFLADYYITFDSLYHRGSPNFDLLTRLKTQGRLGMFNLGYYDYPGDGPEALAAWKTNQLPRLRQAYAKAKELGMLKQAYIYGCDEVTKEFFPRVEQAVEILKSEFPEVPIMTTTYDQSYGVESVIKSMDAFCPLTAVYSSERAANARRAGKQVWWYICCGPHHPNPNMFIEYPAIEGRVLMGAMTAKFRPDGFLYYEISIWNSHRPIESGPFTDWDPRSWTVYHGDGSWTCVGPNGSPLPTIRLENFRDGLEDYAYFRALESAIASVEASAELKTKAAKWLESARSLLEVPQELVKTMQEYSHDPATVYGYRDRLAQCLEQAPPGALSKQ